MKVCILAHTAAPLLKEPASGSAQQSTLLARHLAARGHQVMLVVPGLECEPQVIDGVLLCSGWRGSCGVRGLRVFTRQGPTLARVLGSARADVYYARGFSHYMYVLRRVADRHDAVSLLALTNDRDLEPDAGRHHFVAGDGGLARLVGRFVRTWYWSAVLRRVDRVLGQNETQVVACRRAGLRTQLVANIVESPEKELLDAVVEFDVVWVGNVARGSRRSKGLRELANVAQALPHARFCVIGNFATVSDDADYLRLAACSNVVMTGPLSQADALARMAAARLVLNTSPSEGFSNVMLEGWSLGKPVVALQVDPNRLLTVGGLGSCAIGDEEVLRDEITRLLANRIESDEIGARARAYVNAAHGADTVCTVLEQLVAQVASEKRAKGCASR